MVKDRGSPLRIARDHGLRMPPEFTFFVGVFGSSNHPMVYFSIPHIVFSIKHERTTQNQGGEFKMSYDYPPKKAKKPAYAWFFAKS